MWSGWTTKVIQPVHIDPALQALIDKSSSPVVPAANPPSYFSAQSSTSTATGFKGSYASVDAEETPLPDSKGDVTMESSADKRSRESPDSTLKSEGKSLKTSGVAKATESEDNISASASDATMTEEPQHNHPETPVAQWKAKNADETRLHIRQMHRRLPAWKLKVCVEALQADRIDLESITKVTGISLQQSI